MPNHSPQARVVAKVMKVFYFMMMGFSLLLVAAVVASAQANTTVEEHIQNVQKVGEGRLTYFVWDVYDAQLYAPNGNLDFAEPFALRLHYLRNIKGQKIADASAQAIRKLGFSDEVKLAAWHAEMQRIFPDVEEGTELTGLYVPEKPTRFFEGDKEIGMIRDPEFGRWFFNIWLSDNTTKPQLRAKLLGQ